MRFASIKVRDERERERLDLYSGKVSDCWRFALRHLTRDSREGWINCFIEDVSQLRFICFWLNMQILSFVSKEQMLTPLIKRICQTSRGNLAFGPLNSGLVNKTTWVQDFARNTARERSIRHKSSKNNIFIWSHLIARSIKFDSTTELKVSSSQPTGNFSPPTKLEFSIFRNFLSWKSLKLEAGIESQTEWRGIVKFW